MNAVTLLSESLCAFQEKACAALSNLACGDENAKEAICLHGGVALLVDACRGKARRCLKWP